MPNGQQASTDPLPNGALSRVTQAPDASRGATTGGTPPGVEVTYTSSPRASDAPPGHPVPRGNKMAMRRALYLLPVAFFMALVGYFALALRPGYDPHELPSAMLDKEAPPFSLPGLNGLGIARDALKGGPVLINFFASWCVPCRIEHPLLMRLAERNHVPLYGIDYKDRPEDATKLLGQLGDPYKGIGLDRDGRVGLDFGVYGVPETYVLDSSGHIRKRFVGPLTAQQIERELLPLLKSLGPS